MKTNLKKKIKCYWETRLPQLRYSKKKVGTKEYYDEIEKLRYSCHYPFLPKIAEFNQHRREKVLEIGCGIGTDLLQYAKNGGLVTGIDLTENAIKITEQRFRLYNLKGELRTADAEKLPFLDNTYDLVFSFWVLHHTPDTQKAINEIYRVLKPGGKAIIMLYGKSVCYYFTLFYFDVLKGELLKMSKQKLLNKHSEYYDNSPLTKFYSKKEIESLFDIFDFVRIYRYNDFFEKYFSKFLASKLGKIMTSHFIIKATKVKKSSDEK